MINLHLIYKRFLRKSRSAELPKYLILLSLTIMASTLTFFTINYLSTARAPRLKLGSGDTLFVAGNKIFNTTIGTKDGTPKIGFSVGEAKIGFALAGAKKVIPTKSGNTAIFKEILPSTDLHYTTTTNGLKEELIINEYNKKNTNVYLFDLLLSNVVPKKVANDFIDPTFKDNQGNYKFHFEKPFAIDASGNRTNNVLLQIGQDKQLPDKYYAKLIVDEAWLLDPTRVYPITIDPTIVHDTTAEFASGYFDRIKDTGSGSAPTLETYYQESISDTNTAALWHMNEASGNILDSSGNSNTGTPTGTTVVAGLMGNARSFNGSSDRISAGTNIALNNQSFTVEVWAKRAVIGANHMILGQGSNTTSTGLHLGFRNTNVFTCAFYGNDLDTTTTYTDLNWHHWACTYDAVSKNRIIYRDGAIVTQAKATADYQGSGTFYIGADSIGVTYFNGSIDEVKISKTLRSAEQIKSDASRRPSSTYTSPVLDLGGATSFVTTWNPLLWTELGVNTGDGETLKDSTSLVAQWNLNETSGTTADNAAGSCGASCDGTLSGFDSTASQDADPDSSWTANNKRWGTGAAKFDGTDSLINAGANPSLDMGSGNFTLETWVNTTDTNKAIVGKGGSSTAGKRYVLALSDVDCGSGQLKFEIDDDTTKKVVCSQKIVNDGKWHHVAGVRDGNNLRLYIDGKESNPSTDITGYGNINSTRNFYIGAIYNEVLAAVSDYINATIDSTRLYSRALTSSEIMSNYQAGNIDLQTRVGSTTDPNDGTWEAWRPTTGETAIDSFDGPYQYNTSDTNLASYWPTDEPTATTAIDVLGGNNLTNTSTVVSQGKYGKGRIYNGTSSHLSCNDASCGGTSTNKLDFTASHSFSISAWIKFNTISSTKIIISKRDNVATSAGYILYVDSINKISCKIGDGTNVATKTSTNTYADGQFHYVVCNIDRSGQTITLYIDGVADSGGTVSTATVTGSQENAIDFRIGALGSTPGNFFPGTVDEVRIYRGILAPSTITQYYLQGSTNSNFLHPSTDSTIFTEGSASQRIDANNLTVDGSTLALWHLDETGGSGAYLKDSTSGANHGTPSGPPTVTNGVSSKGRSFNGSSHTISIANESNFDFERTDSFTLESWIKTSSTSQQEILSKQDSTSPFSGYNLRTNSGALAFILTNTATTNQLNISTTSTLNDGKWHHVAATYAGTSLATGVTLYIDGISQNTTINVNNLSASILNNITPQIGSRNATNNYFTGSIDEVRVSNVIRTAEEIAESYRMGRDHYINKTISSTDLSGKTSLPFYIAADRPGSYLTALAGESSYANYQPDSNTVGFWHLDENNGDNNSFLKFATTNTTEANSYSYYKAFDGETQTVATGDTFEYDTYAATNISNITGIDVRYSDATYARASTWVDQFSVGCNSGNTTYTGQWIHRVCAVPVASNGKTISWIDLVNEDNTNTATVAYYDNIVLKDSAGAIKKTFYTSRASSLNIIDFESNAANTQALTTTNFATEGIIPNDGQPASNFIKDVSGNANHATPTGSSSIQGVIGKGRQFNGFSSYLQTPTIAGFTGGSQLSAESWFKPSALDSTINVILAADIRIDIVISATNQLAVYLGDGSSWCASGITGGPVLSANNWHHAVATYDNTTLKLYLNGNLIATSTVACTTSLNTYLRIGDYTGTGNYFFPGVIDEVRISNTARLASEVRQAYEVGLRSHPITVDFGAKLDSGNLITGSGDLSFTIDATYYGLYQKGDSLFPGDKIIVKENYDGTEYIAQGTVTAITASTGATIISVWDSGSTFPSGGFTVDASVFKWQREYWNIHNETLDTHIDAITNLSLHLTDGSEGRSIWLDDLRSTSGYLSTPAGSTITSSTGLRYLQYRAILTSFDEAVSATLSAVTLDYIINNAPLTPSLDAPSDTATNQLLSPVLTTTTTDADSDYMRYKIELCTNVGMSAGCQTFDQTSSQTGWSGQNAQTSTAYTSGTQGTYTIQTPLSAATTYYWRSYAIDPAGTNTWSATQTPRSFTTTTAPIAPTTPWSEGATNPSGVIDVTPEFSAIHSDPDSDAANFYEIQVNTNNTFTGTVMWSSGSVSMASLANGVRSADVSYAGTAIPLDGAGTTYYWRIRFTDINGALGAFTSTQSFTMNAKPLTSSLDAPLDTATNQILGTVLTTTTTDADSDYMRYKIELCTNVGMSAGCQTFDQTSSQTGWSGQNAQTSTAYNSGTQGTYTIQTSLLPLTTYYWRSYAIDPAGSNTWSNTQTPYSFTTLNNPFEATECRIDESDDKTSLTIKWLDKASDENGYEIERSVNGGVYSVLVTGLAADTISYTDNTISFANTYTYRIAPYKNPGVNVYTKWCTTNQLSIQQGIFGLSGLKFNGLNFN